MISFLRLLFCVIFVISFTITEQQRYGYRNKSPPYGVRGRRSTSIETVFQWNQLNFGFPNERDQQEALANGNFVIENTVPIDVAPHYEANGRLRVFITIPRFTTGIPYSLATVATDGQLKPYPQYNWHSSHGADCDGIVSAFRVAFTPCNQMWVIDSGSIAGVQNCPPQLLLFDLTTDRLVHRYRFNENVYFPRASLFITPVVKVEDPAPQGNCENTKVYIADVNFHGIVIYDKAQNAAWRAEHRFMYPEPQNGKITIADESFILMDGIFAMAIVGNYLYFHALASENEYRVRLNVLNDRAAFEQSRESHPDEFKEVGSRDTGCGASAADSRGNIYCVTFKPISLKRWNVATSYKKKYLQDMSTEADILQFASGMKVVKNPTGKEELWILTNRFQKISAGTFNANEVNYRVLKRNLDDAGDINGIDSNTDLHSQLVFN